MNLLKVPALEPRGVELIPRLAKVRRVPACAALAVLLALGSIAPPARAQAWSGAGAPVCTAPGSQGSVLIVPDGAGGTFIGWTDYRSAATGPDIDLQRLGSDGEPFPGWPANGLPVCTAMGNQTLADMTTDGAGGAYLVWNDRRTDPQTDVYGQRVLGDGTLPPGWPADGLGIAVLLEDQLVSRLASDGAGGFFCVWIDGRAKAVSDRDIYAQHLLPSGVPANGWAANGVPVTNARTYDYAPRPVADPDGGLYVTWNRGQSGQDIAAQHLGADGMPYPTWPDTGIVLCGGPLEQRDPAIVSAPGGGALVVWSDQRNYTVQNTETGFYALRFGPDTSRAAGWPHDGRLLHATTLGVSQPFAASDGAGGVLLGWRETLSATDQDVFVLHADSSGTTVTSVQFPDGVVPVCPEPSKQNLVAFVPDGNGGAYVGFDDYRDAGPSLANPDPYVQHVTGGATIATGWPATGVALTKEPTPETSTRPVAVPGGVVAVYLRATVGEVDVYASLVGLDGVVPALVSLISSEASPGRVRLTWQVAGAPGGEWIVERRDDASPWAAIARAYPDGAGRVGVDDASVAPGARYGYRLAPAAGGAPLGETWLEVPRTAVAFALRGVAPNPVTDGSRVRFSLTEAGPATLALVDPQGRVRHTWALGAGAGEREFALDGLGTVAPGVYWLRLAQWPRAAAARVVLTGR